MEIRPVPLLLLAIPVFFIALGANSIWDANEAFYVETPRQMILQHDYVNPTFNGEPRFNKPVLSYWIVAGFYHAFGESVGVQRLAVALGAMGMFWAAFLMGRAIRSPATGVLAALLLATAPRIVFFSRRIFIDVYITMFMALALACFVLAERHPEHRRRYLLLMYAAMGLGMLTKGPIAVAVPVLVGALWLLFEHRLSDIRRLSLIPGAAILLAIVAPWYLAIYAQHGWEYIRVFFIDENLARYATSVTTERSVLFFVPALFADILLPWAPLLLVPIVTVWTRRDERSASGAAIRRLLWWWIVTIVAVFSFSASKEDLYIFPAIPAAAVLIADTLVATGYGATHRGVRGMLVGVSVLCVALAAAIFALLREGYWALDDATVLAAVLAMTGALALVAITRRRHASAIMALALGFILFNYLFVARALPSIEPLKPVPTLASVIVARATPGAALGFFNMDLPSLVYYLRRPVTKLGDVNQAELFFKENPEVWVLAGEDEWADLQPRVPGACVAARHPLFVAKGSDVMSRRPPPDILLLTTKCQ